MAEMGREAAPVRNRVRELRENKLMTQAQLARKAKVALRTIHSVEKGMNCRMDTKRKILLALGLPAVPGRSAEAPPEEEGGAGPEADGAEEEDGGAS